MKVENIHFKYRTSERSGVEQYRKDRPIVGLYNWPRGQYEALYRSGVKPFVDGMRVGNMNKAYTGLLSIAGTVLGGYAARELAKTLMGKKSEHGAYDIVETLTGYGTGSPGLGIIQDSLDDFKNITNYARQGKIESAIGVMGNRVAFFIPLVQDVVNYYESANDKRGASAMKLLFNAMRGEIEETGYDVERSANQAWQHVLYGTWEKPPEEAEELFY